MKNTLQEQLVMCEDGHRYAETQQEITKIQKAGKDLARQLARNVQECGEHEPAPFLCPDFSLNTDWRGALGGSDTAASSVVMHRAAKFSSRQDVPGDKEA